jgi:Transposase DDE domain
MSRDKFSRRSFPISNLPQVAQALKAVLTEGADAYARASGFVKRRSKMTGSKFVQTLVLGWLKNSAASLDELTQMAAALQVPITPQGLDERFGPAAAELLQRVLEQALTKVIEGERVNIPLLQRFNGIYLQDSTVIPLPKSLATHWSGLGNNRGEATAALKVQVRFEYSTGQLDYLGLQAGRASDRTASSQKLTLPAQALRIADLGYFSLKVLADYDAAGVYFLTRLLVGTQLTYPTGEVFDLPDVLTHTSAHVIDQRVTLGQQQRLACRLIACRVPQEVGAQRRRRLKEAARKRQQPVSAEALRLADWTLIVTNVPANFATWQEILVLLRVRWQIELLFKLWKSQGRLDESRSGNPWRVLCEVYAKLLAMVIQHWVLLSCCWQYPDRSLFKAVKTIQGFVLHLASVFEQLTLICQTLEAIQRGLAWGCRLNKRKKHPNTYQLLLQFT